MYEMVVARAEGESNSLYSSPKDDDESATRASGFESLQKNFKQLADLPVWSQQQKDTLDGCASHFSAEAESLREGLPWEPEDDDRGAARSASQPFSADVHIGDLFRDL